MKKILLSSFFVLMLAIIPTAAMAVEYGGVGGRPANPRSDNPRSESIFIYELNPGESFEDGVEVFNNTEQEATISIGAVDSVGSSDGAFACAQEAADKVGVGSWITLSRTSATIPAGESTVVDFAITVPDNANVGEQSGCITMQQDNQQTGQSDGGVVVTFRSAIRVAVTVPGDIVKAVSFAKIDFYQNEADATLYTIRPSVVNTGNVSLDTALSVRLVSAFGITEQEINATYPVLPSVTASWAFDFNKPFWGGLYRADVTATYNNNVEDGIGQESSNSTTTVSENSEYIFITPSPLALLIIIACLGLLGVLIVLLVMKLVHRRTVTRRWVPYTVQEGDSLQSIAKHAKISWKKLAQANKLRAPYHIEPKQIVKIPPKSE